MNYDAWKELFQMHCNSFRVKGHLLRESKPTYNKDETWVNLVNLVKMWIYDIVTQSLLNMILEQGVTAHTIWKSIETLFCDNEQSRAIELDQQL